jgi:hypothetical protein
MMKKHLPMNVLPGLIASCLVCAISGADQLSGTNIVEPPFRLEHKFKKGAYVLYDFTSELKQTMSASAGGDIVHAMTLTGTTRQVIADIDKGGTTALTGLIGKSKLVINSGPDSTNGFFKDQTWISACRVGSDGRSIRRELKASNPRQYHLREMIDQISECSQICAAFPTGEVTVGSQWTGTVLLPLPGTRQVGRGVSTITAVKEKKGIRYCVIRTDVTSGGEESLDTWKADTTRPDIEVKGRTAGCFDIERGIWLQTRIDLEARFEGRSSERGFEGKMEINGTTKVHSLGMLPAGKVAEWSNRVKALDGILADMYGNLSGKQVKALEELRQHETDSDWKTGLDVTASLVRPLLDDGSGSSAKGNANAGINANTNVSASLLMYKKAKEYADAGNIDKAIETYKAFLAAPVDAASAATLVLAQYRLAGMYERKGERQKALEAYRAVQGVSSSDDYSLKIKEKAKEKERELSAGQ